MVVIVPVAHGTIYDGTGRGYVNYDGDVVYWISDEYKYPIDLTRIEEFRQA